jgi:hypothetical protein
MYRSLLSLIPTADELLALELPELARTLLVHLKSYEGVHGNTVYQNGRISLNNFVDTLEKRSPGQNSEYGNRQAEVNKALLEAWNWIERNGLLIRDPGQPLPWFSISRAGQESLSTSARLEHFERLGLARVKADLQTTGGLRDVGAIPEVQALAWKWVEMKESQTKVKTEQLTFIAESRLEEIRGLSPVKFDLKKLIRLCEELNIAYSEKCYLATAMLTRGLLDHVPPLFGKSNFAEVANSYGGAGMSFRESMQRLDEAARKIADSHLHVQIRSSETLPTPQQVNFAAEIDVLLAEIVRTAP